MGLKSLTAALTVLACILSTAIMQEDPFPWLNYPKEDFSLFRVYFSDHLVVYRHNQSEINGTVTHLFPILSEAWEYAKKSYTPHALSPNYRLYLLLLNDSHKGCLKLVKYLEEFKLPEMDRCDEARGSSRTNAFTIIQPLSAISMLKALGKLLRLIAKEFPTNQDSQLCRNQLSDIVAYDISTYLHANRSNNYSFQMDEEILNKASDDEAKCFENIFLPIFKKYGSPALATYFNYTSMYWSNTHRAFMNLGEFVHYWSGSAGEDVKNFAKNTFNWTTENDEELTKARKTYPYFLYRDGDQNEIRPTYILPQDWSVGSYEATNRFHRDFTSEYFALYTQKSQLLLKQLSLRQLEFISNMWTYFHDNYGSVGPRKVLHLVVWPMGKNSSSCTSSNLRSFIDPIFGMDTVVSCPHGGHSTESVATMGLLVHELGKMALKLSSGTGNWPLADVSDWSMNSILVYDYVSLFKQNQEVKRGGTFDDLIMLYSKVEGKGKSLLRSGSNLFYDWYVPIHWRHGRGEVLKHFIQLLSSNWPKSGNNYVGQLNLGEFVHFWNAAAGHDLRSNASGIFYWTAEHEDLFYKAREDFPKLNTYKCLDCKRRPRDSKASGEGSNSIAWVVGVSISIFILAAFAVGSKFWLYKKRIDLLSNQNRNLTTKEVEEFLHGSSVDNSDHDSHASIHTMAFNNVYEIPKERLVIDARKVLGSGEFGVVYSGLLKTDDDTTGTVCSSMQVAVKTAKPDVEVSYFKAMLSEIKIMAFLGHHTNLVSLLGTVTTNIINREVSVALEFCSKGDLLQHLRKCEAQFSNLWASEISRNPRCLCMNVPVHPVVTIEPSSASYSNIDSNAKKISTLDLLEWSRQISNGMTYLTSRKVIHGDLAARNILLTETNVAKISDFGLSRQLINYSNYLKTSNTPLPWRWLAIESLTKQEFSLHSDIWSFGVTLWEIFSLGKVPYPGRTWDQAFVGDLKDGQRLQVPEFGNDEIYTLMMNCMQIEPAKRIPFQQIMIQIDSIKNQLDLASQPNTSAETHYLLALPVEPEPETEQE